MALAPTGRCGWERPQKQRAPHFPRAGKGPQQFQQEANDRIQQRRAEGHGVALGERDALLALDEVLAVRLYSGPSYQPINAFLRAIATLQGDFRTGLAPRLKRAPWRTPCTPSRP